MKFIQADSAKMVEGEGYTKRLFERDIDIISGKALVQEIIIKAGDSVSDHYHKKSTEIFYGISGGGIFTIDGKDIILGVGDVLVCEKDEVHSVENKGKIDWKYLAVKTDEKGDIVWANS